MLAEIKVETTQLEQLIRKFGQRNKNLPISSLANILVNDIDEMFETEGASGIDGRWEPLRASTIRRRPNRAGGMILQDEGKTANIQVFKITSNSMTVGSPTNWANFHVTGTANMVRRDFLAINIDKSIQQMGNLLLQEYAR